MASKKRSFFLLLHVPTNKSGWQTLRFFSLLDWDEERERKGKSSFNVVTQLRNMYRATSRGREFEKLDQNPFNIDTLLTPPSGSTDKTSGFSRHVRSMLQVSPDVESPSPPKKRKGDGTIHLFYFPLPFSNFLRKINSESRSGEGRESHGKGSRNLKLFRYPYLALVLDVILRQSQKNYFVIIKG